MQTNKYRYRIPREWLILEREEKKNEKKKKQKEKVSPFFDIQSSNADKYTNTVISNHNKCIPSTLFIHF